MTTRWLAARLADAAVIQRFAGALDGNRVRSHAILLAAGIWIAAIVTIATPGAFDRYGTLKGVDFLQFYTYGVLVRTHRSQDLYDAEVHQQIAETIEPRMRLGGFRPNYSPVIAWAMAPLSGLTYRTAMAGFTFLMVGVYVGAIACLLRQRIAVVGVDNCVDR